MAGERRRRRQARQAAAGSTAPNASGSSGGSRSGTRSGWRATVDSFGGFLTIGVATGAVLIILAIVITNLPSSTEISDDAPLGEVRVSSAALHISGNDPTQIESRTGEPPTGGPHFDTPQRTGVYDAPINDGNAIHAMEHGIVWISYQPDLVDEETVRVLRDVADAFGNDTILSPRPQNAMPIALASWGRLLTMSSLNEELAREFIRTNRNRSPEPGVR